MEIKIINLKLAISMTTESYKFQTSKLWSKFESVCQTCMTFNTMHALTILSCQAMHVVCSTSLFVFLMNESIVTGSDF